MTTKTAKNDWAGMSRDQLLEALDETHMLNQELLAEREQEMNLKFPWTGNLGHWYWNIRTNTVTCNSRKVETLGYKMADLPEPVTYQFFTSKLHPDDYGRVMNVMMEHLEGKRDVYEVEYRIRAKDGSYCWYYDRGRITQYDALGKPTLLAGIVFNVTEQKEQEETIRKRAEQDPLTELYSREKSVSLISSELLRKEPGDTCGALMLDIDQFCTVNLVMGRMFGDTVLQQVADLLRSYNRDGGIAGRVGGDEFLLFLPSVTPEQFQTIAGTLQENISSIYIDDDRRYRLSVSIGMTISTENLGQPLLDNAMVALCHAKKCRTGYISRYETLPGQPGFLPSLALSAIENEKDWEREDSIAFAFRVMERMTDLKAAMHVLFSRIIRQFPLQGICVTGMTEGGWRERVVCLWSPEKAFIVCEDLVALTQEEYGCRTKWLQSDCASSLAPADLGGVDGAAREEAQNGRSFPQLYCPVYVQGVYRGNVIYAPNAADYVWTEEAIHTLRSVSNILYGAICKANAENTTQARAKLFSQMSREICEPLSAIAGMTEIAKDNVHDFDRLPYCLSKIDSASRYLLTLMNNVLEMSKLDQGNDGLGWERLSIRGTVEEVGRLIHGVTEEGPAFTYRVDCSHEAIMGDSASLHQVLLNLTANAVKFTPKNGRIDLVVTETEAPDGKHLYKFAVSDTGIGISPNMTGLLLNPAVGGKTQAAGSGILLCRKLVSLMGGTLELESTEGEGSCFSFTLALEEAADSLLASDNRELAGLRILVADDSEVNSKTARELLETHGATVETVPNGREAVERFTTSERGHFDAVLTDMNMPEMGGMEAATQIRRLDRPDATLPIIAASADAFDGNSIWLVGSPMNAYLAKPVDVNQLVKAIRDCLHGTDAWQGGNLQSAQTSGHIKM